MDDGTLLGWGIGTVALVLGLLAINRGWRERAYRLQGKTVLLTGGSRGLGLTMAHQLLAEGARVALCARDDAELEQAQRELEQPGREVLTVPCDVTQPDQVDRMVQHVRDRFGQVDILINNAGTDFVGPAEVMTLQDYDDAMKLHFWAPLYTTYALLPAMRQRQSGRIVNIASIGGKVSVPHMLPYCASKFALVGLSEGLRVELAQAGITVTTVCPGLVRSGAPYHSTFKGQHRKEFAWFNISESLPLLSQPVERTARQVIAALKRGDAEVILSIPAQLSARFHGLFPGVTADLASWANRLLPKAGGIGTERALGKDSQSRWSPSWMSALDDRAAQEHNQFVGTDTLSDQSPKGDRTH